MARKKKAAGAAHKTIRAVDCRYTGFEPQWDGWEEWTLEKFLSERNRAFNFYNYYISAEEGKPGVIEWMERNGYKEDEIAAVKAAPYYLPGITTTTLCVSMNRGMPAKHPKGTYRSDEEFVRERIADAIKNGAAAAKVAEQIEAVPDESKGVSPMVLLQQKTQRTVILDLDIMLDSWITQKEGKVKHLDLYKVMQGHGLSSLACPAVERWLTKLQSEIKIALDKTDEYITESYKLYTRPQLQDRFDALTKMLDDVNRYAHAAKATRAPRVKKPKAADKQIAKLKYCKQDNTFKIASVNPLRVVGAHRLLAFNTKKRVLLDFVAESAAGFAVKGTSLKNVDETNSKCIRLRKPEEFLPIVLNSTTKQIEKAWNQLTTKEGKPRSRINEEIVLLRVFDQPTK